MGDSDFCGQSRTSVRYRVWPGWRDRALFKALDEAVEAIGLARSRIAAPPRICWHRDKLALMPETCSIAQRIVVPGIASERIYGGEPFLFDPPWPGEARWTATREERIECAPEAGDCLIFDAETGRCEARVGEGESECALRCREAVALAKEDFSADGFGPVIEAKDPAYRYAWIELGKPAEIRFGAGHTLHLTATTEPGLRGA